MLSSSVIATGSFSHNCQKESLPQSLLTSVTVCIGRMLHANILKKETVDRPYALSMFVGKNNRAMFVIYRIWQERGGGA